MGPRSKFKIVIGGGGITALTLANMLQLYDIDFVVLEAWPEIAPQVGASIGILPHGNRILDQLGLFQKILDLCPPLDSFHFRDDTGKVVCEFRGMNHSMIERHGYPITFLDRQMVLQVLYDNIKDKTKILTGKRVQSVDMKEDKVVVKTEDGSLYTGDILVGADGVHSQVRSEMWRLANEQSPGEAALDKQDDVPCDYGCVFGISKPCDGIEPGASNSVFRKHESFLVNGGPEGRVYWFYFFKLPQRAFGDDIPKYTKEDERRILARRANDNITPTLKFKEVLDKRISSALVPLQEHVFKRWYFGRIITIGDAAHKFHPIAGHGGNACFESAAVLVNMLNKALAKSHGATPTLAEIERVFAMTQDARQARATTLQKHSHEQQRIELLDTRFHEFIAFHLLPRTDTEDVTFNFSRNMPLAEKLNGPSLEPAPRLVPYKDELLSTPQPRGIKKWYFIAFFLAVSALVHYGMWVWSANLGLESHIGAVLTNGTFDADPTFPLKRKYTGISALDDYLVFLAVVYIPGLNNWDPNFSTVQMYLLGMLIQPIAIWTVEAYRKRNMMTPVAIISVWLTFVQWAGVGIYMPLYYAVYTYVSEPETYWWPLNRQVKIQYAACLFWANMIGYALPTFLMFTPWKNAYAIQNFEALWQVSPMLVPLICTPLGYLYAKHFNVTQTPKKAGQAFPDIPHLEKIYRVTGFLGFLLHAYTLGKILFSPSLTFASVFGLDLSSQPRPDGEGLRAIFLVDMWGFYLATYVWLCLAVWDLKRVGRTDMHVGKACILIFLSGLILGPGATMSVVWHWREGLLAKTSFTPRSR